MTAASGNFCKNHSGIDAHKRCYTCKAGICADCQVHRFHHIFCSWTCIFRYLLKSALENSPVKKEYLILFGILLVVQILTHLILMPAATESGPDRGGGLAQSPEKQLFTPDSVFSVLKNRLTISGNAASPAIIGLKHNGRFVASTISKDGQYQFKEFQLAPGQNQFVVWGLDDRGQAVLIDSFEVINKSERTRSLARSFERLNTGEKILALTFDGGSEANGADSILQVLTRKGVPATFFLTGHFIRKYPDLVRVMTQAGFEIANHSYNHPHLTTWAENFVHESMPNVNAAFIAAQLQRTDSLYQAVTGKKLAPYWRAPFGEHNQEILNWAAQAGYRHIGWSQNCDSWDWVSDEQSDLYRTGTELLEHFLELEKSGGLRGAIILMHLNSNRISDHPFQMLEQLIDSLEINDYKFVNISHLFNEFLSMSANP